ncbi:putative nucleolar protein 16 [Blattamonas nauphoetae]|uniref:Nucleolar protein 16 n=1 Tax=Blattamonas nauphoetae TaxID=2049346 RepID=A0ABQ9YF02_9EUKA|nr:putative nucleolar protein 16 [Blattamonas nauphoetae]
MLGRLKGMMESGNTLGSMNEAVKDYFEDLTRDFMSPLEEYFFGVKGQDTRGEKTRGGGESGKGERAEGIRGTFRRWRDERKKNESPKATSFPRLLAEAPAHFLCPSEVTRRGALRILTILQYSSIRGVEEAELTLSHFPAVLDNSAQIHPSLNTLQMPIPTALHPSVLLNPLFPLTQSLLPLTWVMFPSACRVWNATTTQTHIVAEFGGMLIHLHFDQLRILRGSIPIPSSRSHDYEIAENPLTETEILQLPKGKRKQYREKVQKIAGDMDPSIIRISNPSDLIDESTYLPTANLISTDITHRLVPVDPSEISKQKKPNTLNVETKTMCRKLIAKYGTDYKRMARDINLNKMQLTSAQLRKKCEQYNKEIGEE